MFGNRLQGSIGPGDLLVLATPVLVYLLLHLFIFHLSSSHVLVAKR
jgi:hypothetical protein